MFLVSKIDRLFLILAIAIKLDSPGPVFFKQKRVGRGKRHFYILKFRTMRIDRPSDMPGWGVRAVRLRAPEESQIELFTSFGIIP